jgi:SAM-dependent methyltransferase
MCSENTIKFGTDSLSETDIKDKRVLEIGSYNVNGSLRDYIKTHNPYDYIGIDIREGEYVDKICAVESIVKEFGEESFDIVLSTEMLEHVTDWRNAITNMKIVCKLGGIVLLTTRSYGFPKHDYPYDHWRYEIYDMKNIFSDFTIHNLVKDVEPGVFIKAVRNSVYTVSLNNYPLYNINYDTRVILT